MEILFKNYIEDWDYDRVHANDLYSRGFYENWQERNTRNSWKGVCLVDVYAGACAGESTIRDVMSVF
jgi:hypothetical protein